MKLLEFYLQQNSHKILFILKKNAPPMGKTPTPWVKKLLLLGSLLPHDNVELLFETIRNLFKLRLDLY